MTAAYVQATYENPRSEVAALVPEASRRILDVGCATGTLAESLRRDGRIVEGLEIEPETAAVARTRIDHVWVTDLDSVLARADRLHGPYDCIIFADVIEHTVDPWAVVKWADGIIAPGGSMIISIPNVVHLVTLWNLVVRRRWPYQAGGIFDRTHLRWFGRSNIPDLFTDTEFAVTEMVRTRMIRRQKVTTHWAARLLGDFSTMQFVFRAERVPAGS